MTLDEAIEHARQVARTCEDSACAVDHVQLAGWLTELRMLRYAYDSLKANNAKLRELVADMWHEGAFGPGACYEKAAERLEERTRELGIEVDE